jgi:GNAT superfamily N-acetyltransferase
MAWQIASLGGIDRAAFESGNALLDRWFRENASQHQRRDLARTFVLTEDDALMGFYSLAAHAVEFEALEPQQAEGLPRISVPVVLLARLAVALKFQRQCVGRHLLVDALARVKGIADQIGIRAVEVHAIDERAKTFYQHYGFRALKDSPLHLFMPMHEIRQLFAD